MPKKTTPTGQAAQAQKRASQAKARLAKQRHAAVAKQRAAIHRVEDKHLRSILRKLEKTGVYAPRTTDLTRWKRSHIRSLEREYGQLLDPDKFFFIPVPKKQRKTVKERAPGMDLKATHTGVFFPKAGYKRAKLLVDPKTGDIDVKRTGRVKKGTTRERRYESIQPIANVDEIDDQFDRIRRAAEKLTPLQEGERLAFIIRDGDHAGYSNQVFTRVERMIAYIQNYRARHGSKWTRTLPDWVNFLRSVEIEKTGSSLKWFTDHPIVTPEERRARLRRTKYERATRG